jgi:Holliday junction resolvasome RuvABC endonuclease subunit
MPYEPGSNECHALIEAKRHLEITLVEVSKIEQTDNLREKLIDVHQELEAIHEDYRISNGKVLDPFDNRSL